jgi:hypothetical protein
LGSNAVDPNHIIRFGTKAWGTQFHPEFDVDLARDHIELRRHQLLDILGKEKYDYYLGTIHETNVGRLIFDQFMILCHSDFNETSRNDEDSVIKMRSKI